MKVLVLSEVFPPKHGGSGRWLWEIYRRLPKNQVHVLAGETLGAELFDEACDLSIERLPWRFASWGVGHPKAFVQHARAVSRVYRAVSRFRPDVIHCGKSLPEGSVAAVVSGMTGVPFHCYVHGEELTLAKTSWELTRLTASVLKRAARLIANSLYSKELLLSEWGVADSKITVVHPGVDTGRFCPAPPDPRVRERLGWTDRTVILTVGTLQKRKGQDMVIRALPAIRRRCPNVLFSMIGDGWDRGYLEGLVRELNLGDAVQFLRVPDDAGLIECYQQCDVFALPNRQIGWDFEGFGIVLLEAQACGKPVIAGTSGGTRETMQPSETGELVSCESPEALADALIALLTDPNRRAAMGGRARDWIVSRFDWSVVARSTAQSSALNV